MPENHFIVTINEKELRYIACCDCGLVHEVSYDIYENKVDMHFVRDEGRTIRARIERKKDKEKSPCELLDEALARDTPRPDSSYKEPLGEATKLGTLVPQLLKNIKPGQCGYP